MLLRDGRTLIGYLRSIDQFGISALLALHPGSGWLCRVCNRLAAFCPPANLVFHQTVERIHVGKKFGDIPRGIFIVRGENVVLLGEIVSSRQPRWSFLTLVSAGGTSGLIFLTPVSTRPVAVPAGLGQTVRHLPAAGLHRGDPGGAAAGAAGQAGDGEGEGAGPEGPRPVPAQGRQPGRVLASASEAPTDFQCLEDTSWTAVCFH